MSDPVEAQVERPPSTKASLIAGSVGGALQDTIKTRAQTAPRGQFNGTIDIAAQTFRKEGILAFYKGMLSPLIGVAGVNSLLFGAFAVSKRIVSPFPELSIAQTALAGSMAGAIQSVLCSPVEMFKIRMQGQYGGASDRKLGRVVGDMWREYGFRRGIMRGFWIPAYAGFYGCYETVKRQFQKTHGRDVPVWALIISGGCGGIGYWTACYPFDVVKSRIQLADKPPRGFNYIADTFRTIIRTEGWQALFRGLGPTYLRADDVRELTVRRVPAAASTFVGFELTINALKSYPSLYN